MDQESIVYGVIRDVPSNSRHELAKYRLTNCNAILELGEMDMQPALLTSMFSLPSDDLLSGTYQTQVIHFAASYRAVEYEWERWMQKFEQLLTQMYWVSATVHLETELNGKHTFSWDAAGSHHCPGELALNVQCEWEHDVSFRYAAS